jgi:ribosomal protein S18 acetylase RimI-like enzyme
MIAYLDSVGGISPDQLSGFFVGWADPPSRHAHLKLLAGSDEIVLAVDDSTGAVVGFITGITDHLLSAYIPFLEVLPEYRGMGIGSELVRRMLDKLSEYYMIDLICDEETQVFYERFGMRKASGMMIRNFDRQSGS